ncbi:MAG: hypothetical protein NC820_07910 [Candidatus Omnitrophica bacterium]|nr:hypothetical protein [Candidatus Omnitrophota bacterium]
MDAVYWFLVVIGILIVYRLLLVLLPYIIFPTFARDFRIKKNKKVEKFAKKMMLKNREKTLNKIFDFVQGKYTSEIYKEFLFPKRHFYTEVDKLLEKSLFLPCHIQNLILRTLLIATKQFAPKDFKRKFVLGKYGAIHQYLLIKVGKKRFKADPFFNSIEEIKGKK